MMEPLFAFSYLAAITLLPFIELRGSIPVGIALGLDPTVVFIFCTTVNLASIPVAFLFLDVVVPYARRMQRFDAFLDSIHAKAGRYVDAYGALGMALLVSIPLPGTGAYTAIAGTYLLGMQKRSAFPAIALGVVISGIIVTAASVGMLRSLGL